MATNTTNFNLSKPAYADTADIAVINSNMDKVDTSLQGLGTGLAIISNANTHVAITSGQYVYVHGHGSLAEGLYTAKSNISANATLSTSNLQAVSGGGLNALNSKLASYQVRTYSIDCTTSTNVGNKYSGVKDLNGLSEMTGAKAIVPMFARKSGYSYICTIEFEPNSIRIQSDVSLEGVNVGVLFIY